MGDLLRGVGVIGAICLCAYGYMNALPEDPDYQWRWWYLKAALVIDAALIADLAWRFRWVTF